MILSVIAVQPIFPAVEREFPFADTVAHAADERAEIAAARVVFRRTAIAQNDVVRLVLPPLNEQFLYDTAVIQNGRAVCAVAQNIRAHFSPVRRFAKRFARDHKFSLLLKNGERFNVLRSIIAFRIRFVNGKAAFLRPILRNIGNGRKALRQVFVRRNSCRSSSYRCTAYKPQDRSSPCP